MIKLEGITKSFGSLQVLKGIDLEINKGEIVSIVGPSGAGKTTLLQIMGTLDEPDAGTVQIDGTVVSRMKEKVGSDLELQPLHPLDDVILAPVADGFQVAGGVVELLVDYIRTAT